MGYGPSRYLCVFRSRIYTSQVAAAAQLCDMMCLDFRQLFQNTQTFASNQTTETLFDKHARRVQYMKCLMEKHYIYSFKCTTMTARTRTIQLVVCSVQYDVCECAHTCVTYRARSPSAPRFPHQNVDPAPCRVNPSTHAHPITMFIHSSYTVCHHIYAHRLSKQIIVSPSPASSYAWSSAATSCSTRPFASGCIVYVYSTCICWLL